jgi:hypothetical protein
VIKPRYSWLLFNAALADDVMPELNATASSFAFLKNV